jgi:hypothetical protein
MYTCNTCIGSVNEETKAGGAPIRETVVSSVVLANQKAAISADKVVSSQVSYTYIYIIRKEIVYEDLAKYKHIYIHICMYIYLHRYTYMFIHMYMYIYSYVPIRWYHHKYL